MPARKRYRQLRLEIDELAYHYEMVRLSFKLNRREVNGILNGSASDWTFESNNPAFLKIIPTGRLSKYAFWLNGVPKQLNKIYKGIWEAAIKAGCDIAEKEDQH
jgi:hypothetical protein